MLVVFEYTVVMKTFQHHCKHHFRLLKYNLSQVSNVSNVNSMYQIKYFYAQKLNESVNNIHSRNELYVQVVHHAFL